MTALRLALFAFGAVLLSDVETRLPGPNLTFEQRIEAQRSIERVQYAHLIGATQPFDEVVTDDLLRKKVTTYLKQTAVLEEIWHTPVTAEMLRSEVERMTRNSRMPERLAELRHALGDDPLLIQECLARPALVDRLARGRFSSDLAIHADAWRAAETQRERLVEHDQSLSMDDSGPEILEPRRSRARVSRSPEHEQAEGRRVTLELADFNRELSLAPATPGEPGPVDDEGERLVIRTMNEDAAGRKSIAVYAVPKTTWDEWWSGIEPTMNETRVETVADPGADLTFESHPSPTEAQAASCMGEMRWSDALVGGVPSARFLHTAVWTGSRMIVWGGTGGGSTGAQYDPATDAWIGITSVGAPSPRILHTAVWTGSLMLIWGGGDASTGAADAGARYDPLSDTWTPISFAGAPAPRTRHTAVWTGSRMIVWGGLVNSGPPASGGRYDPATDTWAPVTESGAPSFRDLNVAVWTGSVMVVWGGSGGGSTGGRYNPVTDTWQATSLVNAPSPRYFFDAVWTGSRMIVWGGTDGVTYLATGGRYDPVADTWSATSTTNAPASRFRHTLVWTGSRMIAWGGAQGGTLFSSGGSYNPTNDTWVATSVTGAPQARSDQRAVWTGTQMIVWGGQNGGGTTGFDTGGRYTPGTDTWAPTSVTALSVRNRHSAIWTGSEMIVWGGALSGPSTGATSTGGRYDPATDTWRATSTTGAPAGRHNHVAVWTGTRMVIWGGQDDFVGAFFNTGGRYNPTTDTWQTTTATGAPFDGLGSTWFGAVWTGSRMVVWGFNWTGTGIIKNVGGRYDPVTNAWTSISLAGAPPVRGYFSTIWTGSRMVIWGGLDPTSFPSPKYNTGGRYDPVADAWSATSLGLSARAGHTAVWTGSRMAVWGGEDPNTRPLNTGGLYDPVADGWTAVSTTGAPSARWSHLAVWTGQEMIIWGGFSETGGRYNPASDVWMPTPLQGAPANQGGNTAVWTGSRMIVYGGVARGGVLLPDTSPDGDLDGFKVCSGDCDDTRATVHPGAPEICDGLNNDCSSPSWPALPASERDDDGDSYSECQDDCDDAQAAAHPGATEVCDLIDNDCDAAVDEGFDQDGDQWTTCGGDCNDTRASVYPGAPQVCDGLNDDCSSPAWPSLAGTNETDNDGDSLSACAGDCDDTTPETHPGALEVNDGKDNQCPGEAGAGSIDEISGEAGFVSAASTDQFCWTGQAGATQYETLRGDDAQFLNGCDLQQTSSTCLSDPAAPPPDGARFYLVRALLPNQGSWGKTSAGQERSYPCAGDTWTFNFVDTPDDDIPSGAIQGFLESLTVDSTQHIFVGLETSSGVGGAWCAERADFYRDRYLTLASSQGSAISGSWSKWFRSETGPWSSGTTAPLTSVYGTSCASAWSWCAESAGQPLIANPSSASTCEGVVSGAGCGDGTWRLTIRIGSTRPLTCGF